MEKFWGAKNILLLDLGAGDLVVFVAFIEVRIGEYKQRRVREERSWGAQGEPGGGLW